MELKQEKVSTDQLLIDPNNPRYFDLREHEPVACNRFAEEQIQIEAASKLFDTWDIKGLRDSILTNGFICFEYIVVKPYQHAEDKYLVIEGNRRLASVNRIRMDHARGVLDSGHEELARYLDVLDVLVFSGNKAEEKIIQGIRHVAGPKEWKSYQQALLVQDLHESQGMDFAQIQNTLGLGPTVVRRVYHTLKAFEQMREDEEYADLADRELFSLFLEMISRPTLRTWLEWSNDQQVFLNDVNRKHIYRMIAEDDTTDDESVRVIRNPQDMRAFARILGHQHRDTVLDRLLNGDISVEQAWAILEPGITPWHEQVSTVTQALEKLPADELQSLTKEKEKLLRSLEEVIVRKLEQASRLRSVES